MLSIAGAIGHLTRVLVIHRQAGYPQATAHVLSSLGCAA
jgi:hypothetical protein